jgi:polyphosphate kinase 2 (PPK2 family)
MEKIAYGDFEIIATNYGHDLAKLFYSVMTEEQLERVAEHMMKDFLTKYFG